MGLARRVLSTTAGRVILAAATAAVLALAWWLGSPLFLSKTVDEEFPLTVDATVPENMTRAEVEAVMKGMAMVDAPMSEAMMPGMAEATAVKMGTFRDADRFHKGSGSVTIYRLEDGSHVLRLEEFAVTNGPDLRVILSPHADPHSSSPTSRVWPVGTLHHQSILQPSSRWWKPSSSARIRRTGTSSAS